MYLTLKEPQRKIASFIENEIKRDVAQTNYITKIRKIKYLNSKDALLSNEYDVLLISNIQELDSNYESIITKTKTVIIINASELKDFIINFGFQIETETDQLVVLKKKQ